MEQWNNRTIRVDRDRERLPVRPQTGPGDGQAHAASSSSHCAQQASFVNCSTNDLACMSSFCTRQPCVLAAYVSKSSPSDVVDHADAALRQSFPPVRSRLTTSDWETMGEPLRLSTKRWRRWRRRC